MKKKNRMWQIILGVIGILIILACGNATNVTIEEKPTNINCQPTAIEVTSPPLDTNLSWQTLAGNKFDACGISVTVKVYTTTLLYTFQDNEETYIEHRDGAMLKVKYSDEGVKYFSVDQEGILNMAEE